MRSYRFLLRLPLANLRHHLAVTAVGVIGAAAAVCLVATLLGFLHGYRQAVAEEVDRLGFDLLITAKGCPYEAATLMLRGGVGLQYMPEAIVPKLRADPDVAALYPQLIHPVRDPSRPDSLTLVKGVAPGWFDAHGLELAGGAWFEASDAQLTGDGVVLGFEVAELAQRRPGDPFLLWDPRRQTHERTTVRGVLRRSGTQVDGTVLLPLPTVQRRHDLQGQLTGVGVRLRRGAPGVREAAMARYDQEPGIQVVSLSKVEQTLSQAATTLQQIVTLLAGVLALMAGAVLLNTATLRTLADAPRLYALHAVGLPRWFLWATATIEAWLTVTCGTVLGWLLAWAISPLSTGWLASYLPYAPEGDLIRLPPSLLAALLAVATGLALIATTPALWLLRRADDPSALRGG